MHAIQERMDSYRRATMADEVVALFQVRFVNSGRDDEPLDGDREKWMTWALANEGPELALITSFCALEDVEFYGWPDDQLAETVRELEAEITRLREGLTALMEAIHAHQVPADNEAWPLWDELSALAEPPQAEGGSDGRVG